MNKIGIIAGAGSFPVLISRQARDMGYDVVVVGFENITPPKIENIARTVRYFKLGQISSPIEFLKSEGVRKVLMAGSIPHVSVFSDLSLDFKATKLLFRLKDKKTGAIFNEIVKEFSSEGIEAVHTEKFLEPFLPAEGMLTPFKISETQKKDMEFGWKVAKTIADLDIGLTVAVKDRTIIAVEALEGTDECIKRAGEIFKKSKFYEKQATGFVIVKVARTSQDMRFDLPVVGVKTVEVMAQAGANLLAIESRKTLIFEKDLLIQKATENKISVISIEGTSLY
jgi:DUF1009 family protein